MQRDDGFTLVELMVVVLILAILLGIGIPTYLGARTKANDRAAQSNLRNAYTNELAFYADIQTFTDGTATLEDLDGSVEWTTTASDMFLGPTVVYVQVGSTYDTDDTLVAGARSGSGTCFWLRSVGARDEPRFASNDCVGTPPGTAFRESW